MKNEELLKILEGNKGKTLYFYENGSYETKRNPFKKLYARVITEKSAEQEEFLEAEEMPRKVGDFFFANGKSSADKDAYPDVVGVIAWLNPDENAPKGKRGIVVTPEEEKLSWMASCFVVGARSDEGAENMKTILAQEEQKHVFPAIAWIAQYCQRGVRSGQAFLPSLKEYQKIMKEVKYFNPSLAKIGIPFDCDSHWGKGYWTSSEGENFDEAIAVRYTGTPYANTFYGCKIYSLYVRAFVKF